MRSYFRHLPYRRLVGLVLAASQFYLPPEPPDGAHDENILAFAQVYPAITETLQS